jgi:phage tail-like protein
MSLTGSIDIAVPTLDLAIVEEPARSPLPEPAVTVCFVVSVDGIDLGTFTSCEGLGCEVTVEAREEGGNNRFIHQFPGRMKFSNVKFSRPINAESSRVARWMASMVHDIRRHTATIEARRVDGTVVCSWNLDRVFPVKWQGPRFNVDGPKVATETLELAHHGFLPGS